MVVSLRRFLVPLVAVLGVIAPAGAQSSASVADAHGLLVLQATARMAAGLAEGNQCAGIELKPRIEATLRYLMAAPPGDAIVNETVEILAATRYDAVPCDTPCPPLAGPSDLSSDIPFSQTATARHTAALNEIVTHWLRRAERDPPTLSIAVSRHSHDPLPRYLPGQAVDFLVHVGPSCHGAVLSLDRKYELPGSFDGSGSFTPPRAGLWSVHVTRRDGLTLSPLTYLDAETGLPSYYREFWVGTEAVRHLGPGGLGPWVR